MRHKDRDARWTVKFTTAKPQEDGTMPAVDLAIPAFGYKSHISIDRRFRLIQRWKATDASAHDGTRLREGLLIAAIPTLPSGRTREDQDSDNLYNSAMNHCPIVSTVQQSVNRADLLLLTRSVIDWITTNMPQGRQA